MNLRFTVIGINDSGEPAFSPQVLQIIRNGKVFSGGKRHLDIVRGLLPPGASLVEITVPLSCVFSRYENIGESGEIIIFASGDPLFFGFGGTLRRQYPDAEIRIFPTFNSLQLLAHRLAMPYEDATMVSLTGRPWRMLDAALIERKTKIGLLTDRRHTPAAIAERLLRYGFDDYRMALGELLGNDAGERIGIMSLHEATKYEAAMPNALYLLSERPRPRPLGIRETEFALLNNRAKMITKAPIRLASLSAMKLESATCMWDIGFCTGSVSVEAKLRMPQLEVIAFEQRPEGSFLMAENCRRFGCPGITAVIRDFFAVDLSAYPRPDTVFIGGHGGRLREMIAILAEYVLPGGRIVFNAVSEGSRRDFIEGCSAAKLSPAGSMTITLDAHNPVCILTAEK